jgi:hypothetical protein
MPESMQVISRVAQFTLGNGVEALVFKVQLVFATTIKHLAWEIIQNNIELKEIKR